jgi:hypothetical protein
MTYGCANSGKGCEFLFNETAPKSSASIALEIISAGLRQRNYAEVISFPKTANLLGFWHQNVPEYEQNLRKPEKTCGNRRFVVDKALGKDEGELRYSSPDPHEH